MRGWVFSCLSIFDCDTSVFNARFWLIKHSLSLCHITGLCTIVMSWSRFLNRSTRFHWSKSTINIGDLHTFFTSNDIWCQYSPRTIVGILIMQVTGGFVARDLIFILKRWLTQVLCKVFHLRRFNYLGLLSLSFRLFMLITNYNQRVLRHSLLI